MEFNSLISLSDLTLQDIQHILEVALAIKQKAQAPQMKGNILGCCFFEPSTRTRLSFEAAMIRLGGQCIGFSDAKGTSLQKGESFADTIKVMEGYCDVIVVRHPDEGAATLAANVTSIPVINGGDGAGEHPTQTLTDLFTLLQIYGTLKERHIVIVGDLLYGRTAHSLAKALARFGAKITFVAEKGLEMPAGLLEQLNAPYAVASCLNDVIQEADALYMTRLQKERHKHIVGPLCHKLTPTLLKRGKPGLKVLHPLPRRDEIDPDVDHTAHANYFSQAKNGLYVRQALLSLMLQEKRGCYV